MTPPLPPPNGMPTTAHFQVIHIARALTSSRRHVLVIADAALGRAAAEVVLDPIAREDLDRAVVHLHREVDGQLALRLAQNLAQARGELEMLGGQVELALGDVPRVDRGSDLLGRHRPKPSSAGAANRRRPIEWFGLPSSNVPDNVAAAFRSARKAAPQVPLGAEYRPHPENSPVSVERRFTGRKA